jgi:hypothetical protein
MKSEKEISQATAPATEEMASEAPELTTNKEASFLTLLNLFAVVVLSYGGAALLLGKPGVLNPVLEGVALGYFIYGREALIKSTDEDAPKLAQLYGFFAAGMAVVFILLGGIAHIVPLALAGAGFALGMGALPIAELSDGQALGSVPVLRSLMLALTSLEWWMSLGTSLKASLADGKEILAGIPSKLKAWYQDLVAKFTPGNLGEDE